jgi:hypothetical protein
VDDPPRARRVVGAARRRSAAQRASHGGDGGDEVPVRLRSPDARAVVGDAQGDPVPGAGDGHGARPDVVRAQQVVHRGPQDGDEDRPDLDRHLWYLDADVRDDPERPQGRAGGADLVGQPGGAVAAGRRAHLVEGGPGDGDDLPDVGGRAVGVRVGQPPGQLRPQRDLGQPVSDRVVQVAREAQPLPRGREVRRLPAGPVQLQRRLPEPGQPVDDQARHDRLHGDVPDEQHLERLGQRDVQAGEQAEQREQHPPERAAPHQQQAAPGETEQALPAVVELQSEQGDGDLADQPHHPGRPRWIALRVADDADLQDEHRHQRHGSGHRAGRRRIVEDRVDERHGQEPAEDHAGDDRGEPRRHRNRQQLWRGRTRRPPWRSRH